MLPIVVIAGRPNVGKSTLFNRLAGRRIALVADTPGVTRDRKEAEAQLRGRMVRLIDTAGLEEAAPETLAGRMRAGGACIPGFYTRTGVGTVIAEGKEHKDFDGQTYILERGIVADLSIVKAWKADPSGNLVFRKTARNFNPPAATCGKVCVAEVEEIVPLGSLDPDKIHLPGIYVHRIIQGEHEKRIENRTVQAA